MNPGRMARWAAAMDRVGAEGAVHPLAEAMRAPAGGPPSSLGRVLPRGPACCAGDWAAMDPSLRAEGLRTVCGSEPCGRREGRVFRLYPEYSGRYGLDALREFFDLTEDELMAVAWDGSYGSPPGAAEIAARIRQVAAGAPAERQREGG